MLTLKSSGFRPAYKHQVNFNHPHVNCQIDPHAKNKSFSARTQNRSRFWLPHKKQVKFNPNPKTKSISIQHVKTDLIGIPSMKPSQF